ncbi:MAG: serine protease [Candidatus Nealsonbacteria bacterium]|nr:serine protease [Candidatus Nealsonbacteria bacterium]
MAKNILKILAIFAVGAVGGICAEQILWPYFVERPLFHKYNLEQSPVYVTEKKETTLYVQENIALRESVQSVVQAVVGVKTKTKQGEILEGSGLIVTSDGLIVTLASLVPQDSDFYFFVDGKWPAYQILKRDFKNDLALVKVERGSLKTRGFAEMEKIKLAEPIFLVGADFIASTTSESFLLPPQIRVNQGIISILEDGLIQTNIYETQNMAGSPIFNIEGRVVGLSVVKENGRVSVVPVDKIRAFIGY